MIFLIVLFTITISLLMVMWWFAEDANARTWRQHDERMKDIYRKNWPQREENT